jgi:DMSO/TMAO reductase YedYZ molybdopterin-dependent catalytic subunit
MEMAPRVLRYQSRRDFLVFGAVALAVLAGTGFLLPQDTLSRMRMPRNMDSPGKEWFLNQALHIDDDGGESLYSGTRRVPTYTKSQITSLKNNYNGATPDPSYISGWKLTLGGLASGLIISLDIRNLLRASRCTSRLRGWFASKAGVRSRGGAGPGFGDLLRAHPPMSQAKYPQTLLATHFDGQPLTVDPGAPLRLLVPVKLGLRM